MALEHYILAAAFVLAVYAAARAEAAHARIEEHIRQQRVKSIEDQVSGVKW